jgi:hypothetical protein
MNLHNPISHDNKPKNNSGTGRLFFQPKLTVNTPGDIYEKEADSMADKVMRMAGPSINQDAFFKPVFNKVQRKCQACEEEGKFVHRKESGAGEAGGGDHLDTYVGSLGSPGQPMPESSKKFFEPKFGRDFSNVKLHTDSVAAKSARSINALAYTSGNNIVFNSGQFAPGTRNGDKLMAHELTHVVQQGAAGGATVQRKKENEDPLAKIQGEPMYSLLPKLKSLADGIRTDEDAARAVGGPRLVTAMRAVNAGGTWNDFVASHNGELATLPADQINDIMNFMGASKQARYFKDDQFANQFDGSADPASGVITLYFRVRFEVNGAKFGLADPGTADWERETQEGLRQYKIDFKRVVEDQWSGKGTVKPACAIGGASSFNTKVVVTVVESGEHKLIYILKDVPNGRSNVPGTAGQPGSMKVDNNKPHTNQSQVVGTDGKPAQVTTTQTTSAHEFGHAIGLQHSRCVGDGDCYGVTAEERQDVMGAGNMLQVIKRGGQVKHDDFVPFERIGERWGRDIMAGGPMTCNTWSAN